MSFHTHYQQWLEYADPACCPVCRNDPMPGGMVDIVELPHSWLVAEPVECLKGACHLVAKQHVVELYELPAEDLLALMQELQICARAQHIVTRAVKINYEIHGNTAPHLHIHLYPRYMDDPFPGQPIDYRRKVDQYAPGAFDAFVESMRAEIARLRRA